MSHNKIILAIKGMHCRSCEILLEGGISKIRGVKKVRVDHKKGIAEIEHNDGLDMLGVENAVAAAGYSVGKEDKKHFFSRNPLDYAELMAAGTILWVVYLVLKSSGIFDYNPAAGSASGLIGVLVVGLTAGVSTCMALIGGLVLGISSRHAEKHPEATVSQKFRPHIFFNLGRLISYVVLGGFIGLIGSAFKLSSSTLGLVTIFLGFVMMFMGLKLIEIFPRLHNKSFALPKSVAKLLGLQNEVVEYSNRGSFISGALTFFVPCGFTQAMQLYAVSTGSFLQGALIMGIFAFGTLPGILGIGGLTSTVKGAFARYFFKFAGLVVIALAIFNISSGYNLSGLNLNLPKFGSENNIAPVEQKSEIKLTDGKQVVEMNQSSRGYSPRQFTIKKGIPVKWIVRSTSQYTCAAYINMPGAGISQPLETGENVIEFTPTKTGKMRFTCSMGMYSGSFEVID